MELRRIFGMNLSSSLETYIDIDTTHWIELRGKRLVVGVAGPKGYTNTKMLDEDEARSFLETFPVELREDIRKIGGYSVNAYYNGKNLCGVCRIDNADLGIKPKPVDAEQPESSETKAD